MTLLLREAIGGSLRRARTARRRTLRDVSGAARVSLGYLSEVERGRKEASSELLAAICDALELPLPQLLGDAAAVLRPVRLDPVGKPVTVEGAHRLEAAAQHPDPTPEQANLRLATTLARALPVGARIPDHVPPVAGQADVAVVAAA